MSVTSVDLPEPDTPVTATNIPSGNVDRQVPEVVLLRADDAQRASPDPRGRRRGGTGMRSSPRR